MNCSPHYHLYPVYKEGGAFTVSRHIGWKGWLIFPFTLNTPCKWHNFYTSFLQILWLLMSMFVIIDARKIWVYEYRNIPKKYANVVTCIGSMLWKGLADEVKEFGSHDAFKINFRFCIRRRFSSYHDILVYCFRRAMFEIYQLIWYHCNFYIFYLFLCILNHVIFYFILYACIDVMLALI